MPQTTKAPSSPDPPRRSHDKPLPPDPRRPFPVGVEYYRPPMPPRACWDRDLAHIRAAGMSIVRTFYSWDWSWPEPDRWDFSDLDVLMDLAAKHDLKFWIDTPLGTHMACPGWMIRNHPDMRAQRQDGSIQHPVTGAFAPHGVMIHNFDHPMWRVYVEQYLRRIVPRYRDHPAMQVWGTWDGISFAAAWSGGGGFPPYNDYTIERYRCWLQGRYTLEALNDYLRRRFASWQDVEPPRTRDAPVEMLLYREFHYHNMADHLGWMADLIDQLDGRHEQRSHGASYPRPGDETASPAIDSWGLSHHTANRLDSADPYGIACEAFGFLWARTIGRNGRWWNEEIYSSFVGGLRPTEKRTLGEESSLYLWLSVIEGAAGALYWQYRPEYMTYEAPGLSLVALDGRPTPRWDAAAGTIDRIDRIAEHLPLIIDPAPMAVAYSAPSHEVFWCDGQDQLFIYQLRGLYRTLWKYGFAQDIVTPARDWSAYRLVYLPNFALLDDVAVSCLRQVLQDASGPALVADGHFGTFAGNGHWSLRPPEGLDDLVAARVADFQMINRRDIETGANVLTTEWGEFRITTPCQYLILEPQDDMAPIATIGDDVVGVRSVDGRFTWFGISLCHTDSTPVSGQPHTGSPTGVVHPTVALGLAARHGIEPACGLEGDRVVACRRRSAAGGSLLFLLNVEPRTARTTVAPHGAFRTAHDLLHDRSVPVKDGRFSIELDFGDVAVFHLQDS